MYPTVKVLKTLDSSLAVADAPGIVRGGPVGPVLCSLISEIMVGPTYYVPAVESVSAYSDPRQLAELRSDRSGRVAGHASVEQLISAL